MAPSGEAVQPRHPLEVPGITARIITSHLYLEEICNVRAASRGCSYQYESIGGAARCRVRAASRERFWAHAVQVEGNRRRRLARLDGTGVGGYFERCAGLDRGRGGLARLGDKGVEGEIKRDVRRTFASRSFFAPDVAGGGQDLLADVLVALAKANAETSYCQGMNLVAGALLEVHVRGGTLDDVPLEPANGVLKRRAQRRTFWLVAALADGAHPAELGRRRRKARDNRLELSELWRPGMPQLKLRVFQFDRLVSAHLPRLRAHFRDIGLAPDVLASQWFFTVFAYVVPIAWLPRLWDACFHDGWKAVYRLSLALLSAAVDELCRMSLDAAGKYLRDRDGLATKVLATFGSVEGLVAASCGEFKVSRKTLGGLAEQFGFALLEERCVLSRGESDQPPGESWLERYGGDGDAVLADAPAAQLAARLEILDDIARTDATCLMARIERAERDTAETLDRVSAATSLLEKQRAVVGALVDEKRRCSAVAARRLESAEDRAFDDDDDVASGDARPAVTLAPPGNSLLAAARFGPTRAALAPPGRLNGRAASAPEPRTNLGWFASLFPSALSRDRSLPGRRGGFVPLQACRSQARARGRASAEVRGAQKRAELAERSLRVARADLLDAARAQALALADLDDARETKRGAKTQLLHILVTSNAQRRATLSDAVSRADTPDLKLVRRMSQESPGPDRSRAPSDEPPPLLDVADVEREAGAPRDGAAGDAGGDAVDVAL